MTRLPLLLLIGALAVGGLTACMGDDEGEQSDRRIGALDPTEKSTVRTLSLTVANEMTASGYVRSKADYGRPAPGTPVLADCVAAAQSAKTCTWRYLESACPVDKPDCKLSVVMVAVPPAGTRVLWEGCSSQSSICVIELPGDQTVKATFIDAKKTVRKLTLTVANQMTASGYVRSRPDYGGPADGTTPVLADCVAAAQSAKTCTWAYLQGSCPIDKPDCKLSVVMVAVPPAGTRVLWEGCSSQSSICVIELPGDQTVKATFAPDPKG